MVVTRSNTSLAELERNFALAQEQLRGVETRIARTESALRKLKEKLGADEVQRRDLKHASDELQTRIFVRSVLRSAVLNKMLSARKSYLAQLSRYQSDDITVAEQRQLRGSLQLALTSLQSLCTHPFVFSYDGYRGSQSDDFDDRRFGHRVCKLCNLSETSEGTSEDIYQNLAQDNTRVVRRDLRNEKDRPLGSREEWFRMSFLRQLFEDSAWGININWPKGEEMKSPYVL